VGDAQTLYQHEEHGWVIRLRGRPRRRLLGNFRNIWNIGLTADLTTPTPHLMHPEQGRWRDVQVVWQDVHGERAGSVEFGAELTDAHHAYRQAHNALSLSEERFVSLLTSWQPPVGD
jgi:hypothetical protein